MACAACTWPYTVCINLHVSGAQYGMSQSRRQRAPIRYAPMFTSMGPYTLCCEACRIPELLGARPRLCTAVGVNLHASGVEYGMRQSPRQWCLIRFAPISPSTEPFRVCTNLHVNWTSPISKDIRCAPISMSMGYIRYAPISTLMGPAHFSC